MDRPINSLAFKGSISEAILEAKKWKKLFVVYISGEDEESIQMENATWTDNKVAEAVLKYCILLHLLEGSTDAANFSAIYPQKTAPCITVVGYNGMQLSQTEGLVLAEMLASSIEKAWLSLHIQETTASVLTAALASKKAEPSTFGTSDIARDGVGSSSNVDVAFLSTAPSSIDQPLVARPMLSSVIEDKVGHEHARKEMNAESSMKALSEAGNTQMESSGREPFFTPSDTGIEAQVNSGPDHCSLSTQVECLVSEKYVNVAGQDLETPEANSRMTDNESNGAVRNKSEAVDDNKASILDSCVNKSTDVHLNIRLPGGASLKEKFPVTSTVIMVKNYIDRNQASSIGSYDLAIPYPRRVFTDQDLSKSLSELGLLNRQAMIVVPHQQSVGHYRAEAAAHNQTTSTDDVSSNGSDGGYFAYVRRILSYVNPFSYFGGSPSSSSSALESQTSMWQYGPNPSLQSALRRSGTPSTQHTPSDNTSEASRDNRRGKRPSSSSSPFGSNIHTLKHDEDDGRFGDRNAFWNGNSTQYGGDSDKK